VVVREDDGRGVQLERSLHHDTRVDGCAVDLRITGGLPLRKRLKPSRTVRLAV
jgi:hypothetical protein